MRKKICILLCLSTLILSLSLCTLEAEGAGHAGGLHEGFSVPTVYILPSEGIDISPSAPVCTALNIIEVRQSDLYKNVKPERVYLPDILEQIDLISVAPRE